MRLVLASRSPQRKAILEQLGVPFEVRPADVREEETGEPVAVAAENARRKALAVPRAEGEVVLGVDTVVATEGGLWGKPADEQEARTTLLHLAGRAHEVHSGIVVLGDDGGKEAAAVTSVTFRAFGPDVLEWYVRAGEWRGRAGGYAIQGRGAALVERIDGDYLNVVGLPVAALLRVWPGVLALAL